MFPKCVFLDDRDVLKDEFVIMMSAWSIDEEAGKIYFFLISFFFFLT